jgi:hypothetical protein
MSFLRRNLKQTKKLEEDSEMSFELPPGEYFIGGNFSMIEDHYNGLWECEFDYAWGLYTVGGPTPAYYVPTTLHVKDGYPSSDGRDYQGGPGIYSTSLLDTKRSMYEILEEGSIHTFTEPVRVTLYGYGNNFLLLKNEKERRIGLHGIDIRSGTYHLRIANDDLKKTKSTY